MVSALRSLDVAVVGAGAAGLVTARELRRAGHAVTVYEAQPSPGGVWVYTDAVEEGALDGRGQCAGRVHSSMYAGLRTNLPRLLMAYSDFPFHEDALTAVGEAMGGKDLHAWAPATRDDTRAYPGHAAVLAYLSAFESAHGLGDLIRYGARVTGATPVRGEAAGRPALPWPRWRVEVEDAVHGGRRERLHDALMVCSGHFAVPRTPDGLAISPAWLAAGGLVLHSHNYRSPMAGPLGEAIQAAGGRERAAVAVLGAGPSGEDLARELSPHCAAVFLAAARWEADRSTPVGAANNIRACPWIVGVGADGAPVFAADERGGGGGGGGGGPGPPRPPATRLAALVLATGYRYDFHGVLPPGVVSTADNHVTPLADHMWPPAFAPGLALIGLPFKVVPFPLMEAQARRAGRALSGAAPLPPPADLAARAEAQAAARSDAGIPLRHFHCLSGVRQWEYMEGLAAEAEGGGGGENGGGGADTTDHPRRPFMPAWRPALYNAASAARKASPDRYRDDGSAEVVTGAAAVEAEAEARAWAAAVRAGGWSGE